MWYIYIYAYLYIYIYIHIYPLLLHGILYGLTSTKFIHVFSPGVISSGAGIWQSAGQR